MPLDWLPAAVRDPHPAIHGLSFITGPKPKGCLHTTEGPGWPDYNGWSIPPHVTVRPVPGVGVEVRQHIPFGLASFALENAAGGVETNRARVYQIELIGTCDPAQKGRLYHWPEADDPVLADLDRKVIAPMSDGLGIPRLALRFEAYPASYGTGNGVRLQGPTWNAYSGWLGHEHAAENHHGDPGAFPWARLITNGGNDMPLSEADFTRITAIVQANNSALATEVETRFQVRDPAAAGGLETRTVAIGDIQTMVKQVLAAVTAPASDPRGTGFTTDQITAIGQALAVVAGPATAKATAEELAHWHLARS